MQNRFGRRYGGELRSIAVLGLRLHVWHGEVGTVGCLASEGNVADGEVRAGALIQAHPMLQKPRIAISARNEPRSIRTHSQQFKGF